MTKELPLEKDVMRSLWWSLYWRVILMFGLMGYLSMIAFDVAFTQSGNVDLAYGVLVATFVLSMGSCLWYVLKGSLGKLHAGHKIASTALDAEH